jgi:hypothetical protein
MSVEIEEIGKQTGNGLKKLGGKQGKVMLGLVVVGAVIFVAIKKKTQQSASTVSTSSSSTPSQETGVVVDQFNQRLNDYMNKQTVNDSQQDAYFKQQIDQIKQSMTETVAGLSTYYGSQFSTQESQINDITTQVTASNETLKQQISDLQSGVKSEIQTIAEKTITKEEVAAIVKDTIPTVQSPPITQNTSPVAEKSAYEIQKEASEKIKGLQKNWWDTFNTYNEDNVISSTEQAVLDDIHVQAEKTGIAAGLGAGGDDGSKRQVIN